MRTKIFLALLAFVVAPAASATPKIQHWQAPSGAKVYFVEDHNIPMLDVAVTFPAGSAFETADQRGVAGLTNDLLDAGTEGMDEDAIGRKLADIGAQTGRQFDTDRAGLSMRTLSDPAQRDVALDILARSLQKPSFPEAVLSREKQRLIAGLKEAETKPEHLAAKAFGKAVFGDHPYGRTTEVADIEKIRRADLEDFYHQRYSAKHAVVALMGDITRAQAERIANQLTAHLPTTDVNASIPPVVMKIVASEQRIAHPATQSHILIGAPGVARNDPDYFPLYVGNYILGGGGFVSRLMQEIREKRGLAYSVYSYFMPMQQPGAFQLGLQTSKIQYKQAIEISRETLRRFIEAGVTAKELQAAKDNIIGGFPLRIDSNKKILDYLSMIGFYDLPLTYLDDFTRKVDAVTVAQIHEAFRRRLHPEAMATVVVGVPEADASTP